MTRPRILVFDDDLVRYPDFFDDVDADVRVVGHGREAVDEVSSFQPDLVLMDYSMGGAPNGAQVTRLLREQRPWGELTILGISTSRACNREILQAGADHAVQKHEALHWVECWLADR